MRSKTKKKFTESHRKNGKVTEKDIVDAAIKGIGEEGLKRVEFRKEATKICDELRKVRNCGNKLDIKKCAVHLYTRNGIFPNLVNKALESLTDKFIRTHLDPSATYFTLISVCVSLLASVLIGVLSTVVLGFSQV
jgi:hypothetical protein